jgi:hypothetical protein
LFCIRPLAWRDNIHSDGIESFWCSLGMGGSYTVERYRDSGASKWGDWIVEKNIEGDRERIACCKALGAAKSAAFRDWGYRLLPFLIRKQNTRHEPPAHRG